MQKFMAALLAGALVAGFGFAPDAAAQDAPTTTQTTPDATDQPAEGDAPAVDPSTTQDVVGGVSSLVDATRAGTWIGIAAALIALLVNLFKHPALGSLTKKIPSRWRIVIVIGLGGVAGALSSVAGGLPWPEALSVALLSGPGAVFAHEGFVNSLMGKREKKKADGAS